jgi:hypothetical protein
MRWLRRRDDDTGSLRETEGLVKRFVDTQAGMTDAQRARLRSVALTAFSTQTPATARPARRRTPRALALAFALAALLALAGTVGAAQAGPGQPFYGVRLTLESLTLPANGSARTDALLVQLDRRLAEARQERARGHAAGIADAVHAYNATLTELSSGISPGASSVQLEVVLQRHVDVLTGLRGSAPAGAREGLERAVGQAGRARQALLHRPLNPGPAQPERPQLNLPPLRDPPAAPDVQPGSPPAVPSGPR